MTLTKGDRKEIGDMVARAIMVAGADVTLAARPRVTVSVDDISAAASGLQD